MWKTKMFLKRHKLRRQQQFFHTTACCKHVHTDGAFFTVRAHQKAQQNLD